MTFWNIYLLLILSAVTAGILWAAFMLLNRWIRSIGQAGRQREGIREELNEIKYLLINHYKKDGE